MKKTACFTGHKDIDEDISALFSLLCSIFNRFITEQDEPISMQVELSLATDTVLRMSERYPQVKLHLILPCSNADYTKNWTVEQVADFNRILGLIDAVSAIGIKDFSSDTGQTMRMTQQKDIPVINLFEILSNSDNSPMNRLTDIESRSIMELSNY